MSSFRGFAAGTLTLIAMDALATHSGAAGGLLGAAGNLFQSFLSPDVPALHTKGQWPSTAGATSSSSSTGATPVSASLGPAHATVVSGTAPPPPVINTGVLLNA